MQLLVGGKDVSLWALEYPPQTAAAEVLPEREISVGDLGEGGLSGMGTWNELWRCEVAIPVVHLKFSPDSTLFATAGEVRNTKFAMTVKSVCVEDRTSSSANHKPMSWCF